MGQAGVIEGPALIRRDVFKGLLAFAALSPIAGAGWAQAAESAFVPPAQIRFLAAFVDTLIPETDTPGAKAAGVHLGLVGLIGRWASVSTRESVLGAITALQAALDARAGGSFEGAAPAARLSALAAHDAEAFGARFATSKDYRTLKSLAVRLYYTSEVGASQELRYDPLPGGYVGDLPFKAGDRAWAL